MIPTAACTGFTINTLPYIPLGPPTGHTGGHRKNFQATSFHKWASFTRPIFTGRDDAQPYALHGTGGGGLEPRPASGCPTLLLSRTVLTITISPLEDLANPSADPANRTSRELSVYIAS